MTYAKKTLSEIKLIHGNYGNFIKGQKLDKRKEKKYKKPPYQDLAASNEIDGESLDEKCWPGYEKKGMKTMFGKRYPNCVKKKKTRKEEFSDWRSDINIDERKMTEKEKRKDDRLKKKYDKSDDMKKNFIKQYGKKKGLEVYYAYIRKEAMSESHYGSAVNKIPKELDAAVKLHKSQAERLRKSDEFKKDAGKTANKIPGQLDKAVAMHTKQAKELRAAGVGEKNCGCGKTPCKTYGKKSVKEDITDDALTIQNWNVDDIKFTEIETVDIIKAKPLKENKAKIIGKGVRMLGNLSKKTKIKPLSPKSVATPGTTLATGGQFSPGYFKNVSQYAGATPKPTKTGAIFNTDAVNLKPGAFKGGGSSKGRIHPGTGDRVSVKDYKDYMSQSTSIRKGIKYYEPVKGAKFGDKIMATKRKAFEPLKQEKLPYPKPRKEPKFKVRDDATFGDQIMVRKNEPFSRNFIGRTPMPKPLGKAKYEVGKDGATEFMGGADTFSKVNRRFADKFSKAGIKKPAAAPKDASKLYTPKDSYYSTSKKNENILNTVKPDRKTGSSVNPEANKVLFGKGELKTGVKKKGKTIYKENVNLDEKFGFLKKAFGKNIIRATGIDKAMGKFPRLSRKASITLSTNKALKGFKDAIQKVKDLKNLQKMSDAPSKFPRDKQIIKVKKKISPNAVFPNKANVKIKNEIISDTGISNKNPIKKKFSKEHYDWRTEIDEDWQKVNRKDKTDGLSRKAVKAYRRENPGSKLQTAVTKDPKKLKKGSKSAKRRLSFCRRMKGMKKKLTSAKTRRDPDSRINKALRRWNC